MGDPDSLLLELNLDRSGNAAFCQIASSAVLQLLGVPDMPRIN
jgi:hypothetical protein